MTGEQWPDFANFSTYTPTDAIGELNYANPGAYYDSPFLYNVRINHLTPGITYYYQLPGDCNIYSFMIPEPKYPMTIGVFGDIGVTEASQLTVNALVAMKPAVVINTGDLSYADGWHPVWDTYGEMMQRIGAHVPILSTGGNHEFSNGQEAWLPYFSRWPQPHKHSHSTNPCYYGIEVGKATIISLCSFVDYEPNSIQYNWAAMFMSSINRRRTPWVIMTTHMPWYTSKASALYENEPMRRAMEPLTYKFGVDLVVYGHKHEYERSFPVYDYALDPCGAVHITIGDGGNYGGAGVPYTPEAPFWSAFREGSFGAAKLVLLDDNTASWTWTRHSCQGAGSPSPSNNYAVNTSALSCISVGDNSAQAMDVSDSFTLTRPDKKTCPQRWHNPKSRRLQGAEILDSMEADSGVSSVTNGAVIGVVLLSVGAVLLFVVKAFNVFKF